MTSPNRQGNAEGDAARPFGSRILGPDEQSPRSLRIRMQVLLTLMLVSTNVIGAVLVFVISTFVLPSDPARHAVKVALAIAVPVYVVAAVAVGAVSGTTTTMRTLRWATRGREPDVGERTRALLVPLRLTAIQAGLWLGATVLFVVLSLATGDPSRALTTGLTIAIAGVVVVAVAYLLAQFALRPITAKALATQPLTERRLGLGFGSRMVVFWGLGTGAPTLGLGISGLLTLTGVVDNTTNRLAITTLVLSGVVLAFGLLITVLSARSVVAPVMSVRDALLDVESGDLDRSVVVYDGTELGLLQSGFNQMVSGLREREHLRDMFGRHVGQDVARAASSGEVELGGETRVVSVLFVDLVGSTTYATEHTPAEVVEMLNRFFGVVVDEVDARHGLVNKFIGDAVLAVFGAPVELHDHPTAALAAARAIAARLAVEVPEVGAGVGVATGEAVAGNVGSRSRFEYTVIGDAVNCAARLTDLAKDVPGQVLAAWTSVQAGDEEEARHWSRADDVTLRGRAEPTATAVPAQPRAATAAS